MSRKVKIQDDLGLGGNIRNLPKTTIKRRISNFYAPPVDSTVVMRVINENNFPKSEFTPFIKRILNAERPHYTRVEGEEAVGSNRLVDWSYDRGVYIPKQPSKIITLMEEHDFAFVQAKDIQDVLGVTKSTYYKHIGRVEDDLMFMFGQPVGLVPGQVGLFGTLNLFHRMVKYSRLARYIQAAKTNGLKRLAGFDKKAAEQKRELYGVE